MIGGWDHSPIIFCMMNKIYEVNYAGFPVRYSFIYPKTRYLFKRYIKPSYSENYDIRSTEERIERARKLLPEDSEDAYIEYRTLIALTARELLKYRYCIFHCASFVYRGYAWLLTAPSGTGKTTQYFNWMKLFPDEITMISGDMPVLCLNENSVITVNPSSWNGKEDIGNQISAELGGIIYLEQGDKNMISPLSARDGLIDIYRQFIVLPDTEEEIISLAKIIDCMFRRYPVMKYVNQGDEQSTELLRSSINHILEEKHGS